MANYNVYCTGYHTDNCGPCISLIMGEFYVCHFLDVENTEFDSDYVVRTNPPYCKTCNKKDDCKKFEYKKCDKVEK